MTSLSSQYKSAITLSFVFFCVSTPPSQTLEAFDIEFNHFNLVSFNLTLDPSSMFNPNISIVQFDGVGKFGYDSNLKAVSEGLCMPPDNSGKWSSGCSQNDYAFCKKIMNNKKFIALVQRGKCDMSDKAKAAMPANVAGLIIIETSSITDPLALKEYDQLPHTGKFHQTYKTTSLDHSFIREAARREKSVVPFAICTKAFGSELREFVVNDSKFHLTMFDGGLHGTELRVPSSSLLLVFVAFIVLTIISMIWLIFYYVQRFRYHHHQDRVISQVRRATKKAFRMMPTRILRDGDEELDSAFGRCAICLEGYKLWDMVRVLPCSHLYHKSCVDMWLSRKPACPNCKSNVLKALGFDADYDWTCLDANSEPDAISLLDIVPQVVSVQVFAPNTAPPSRFITELATISNLPQIGGAPPGEDCERPLSTSITGSLSVSPPPAQRSNTQAQPSGSQSYGEQELTSVKAMNCNTTIATVEPISVNTMTSQSWAPISSTCPKASDGSSSQSDTFSLNDVSTNALSCAPVTVDSADDTAFAASCGSVAAAARAPVLSKADCSASGDICNGKLSLKRQIKKELKAALSGDSKA